MHVSSIFQQGRKTPGRLFVAKQLNTRHRQPGFTLVELAIVLVIVALLTAGGLLFTRIQTDRARAAETKAALEEAREALLNYAAVNNVLPCPAKNNSTTGISDLCSGTSTRGLIPWADLGIQGMDAWNHRLAYQVTTALTSVPVKLNTPGNVTLRANAGAATNLATTTAVAFAIWSYGQNGYYATTPEGTQIAAPPASNTDEIANRPGSITEIVSHVQTDLGVPNGEFDDTVSWTSRFVLLGRMLEAGWEPPP